MKTLHAYLTRQILASLAMTVVVFTFVLLLGNVLKEILSRLVNHQATLALVGQAIGLLIPFVWVFALPMSMLTATLLIFGRFSADHELTAARASGISLLALVNPVLLLSVALCALSALVNMEIGPRCRVAYKQLWTDLEVEVSKVQFPEGRFIKDLKNYIFYVGKNQKGDLRDVIVFKLQDETNVLLTVHAQRATVESDPESRKLLVRLFDGTHVMLNAANPCPAHFEVLELPIDLNPRRQISNQPRISDMTFTQLCEELSALERITVSRPLQGMTPKQLKDLKRELDLGQDDLTTPIRFQIHRQVAFSFACFGFTLVGIPLGIRVHRRETNIGIAIALLLAIVYYSFFFIGKALDTRPEFMPHFIIWLPNFLFQAVGGVLLWRANYH